MVPEETTVSVVTAVGHVSELKQIGLSFLRLGTTAFGGPAAHIAMMEEEFVRRVRLRPSSPLQRDRLLLPIYYFPEGTGRIMASIQT